MALIQPEEELKAISGRFDNAEAPPLALMSLETFNSMGPVSTDGRPRIEEGDGRKQRQFSMYMNRKRYALPEGGLIPLGKCPVKGHTAPGLSDDRKMGVRAAPLRLRGLRSAAMQKALHCMMMCSI